MKKNRHPERRRAVRTSIPTTTAEPQPKDLVTFSSDLSPGATGPLSSRPLRRRSHPKYTEAPLNPKSCEILETPRKNKKVLRLRLDKSLSKKENSPLASAQDDGLRTNTSPRSQTCCPPQELENAPVPATPLPVHPPSSSPHSVNPVQNSAAINRVSRRLNRARTQSQPPRIDSFADFLTHHARVKSGSGYIPYHFAGREALRHIVERLDLILSSGETDVSLAICGGAQFGKTVLMLNLLAYLVAVRFRNVGYYLPDDDLVSGLVDGKLRPDVLDQIPWLARLIAVGKTLSPSGRAVNRKGAFLCTDGTRTALAFMRGLGKIPTSFSMDVVVQDEKDDLPEEHARFLAGRMTASNLRLTLLIGTQRYHGAGQNLAFTEGTQHIGLLSCPACATRHNPETLWPGICRLEIPERPPCEWPKLTVEGHFASVVAAADPSGGRPTEKKAPPLGTAAATLPIPFTPGQKYVLACPDCGAALDRENPQWHALAPEREAQRRWSYRLSQLLIPGIELTQIVAAWQLAIRDPEHMTVFCTDRLALPKSTTQSLTPALLEQARGKYSLGMVKGKSEKEKGGEADSDCSPFSLFPSTFTLRFGGLDLGDQCWFVARAVDEKPPHQARLLWAEPIAAERVRSRVPELFRKLGLTVLCVDAGPLRDLSRDLVFLLNGLDENSVPSSNDPARNIYFGSRRTQGDGSASGGPGYLLPGSPQATGSDLPPLQWHATSEKWQNVRCAAVEFTQREGHGLRHKLARTQDGRLYPLLAAHRDETIQRVVQELLPPDGTHPHLLERADGTAERISAPRFLLPMATEETRATLDLYERHLLAGARQERTPDGRTLRYLDKCENHFLLATAYAALAELLAPMRSEAITAAPAFRSLPSARSHARLERSVIG